MTTELEQGGSRATIREVMAMIEASRRDVLAELEKLAAKTEARMEAHYTRHETDAATHTMDHRRESDRRAGLIRWAVTTVMTGAGVLWAIAWALLH